MDYASLVHKVRELVWEHIPAGSNVAVVSKGDPALILFDRRNGLHYPQTGAGQYLGHHPDTGAAAVAHLESIRVRGAQYLVVPAIYAWFLDYYTDLRDHLNREGELIHRDEHCTIYSLAKRDLVSANNKTAAQRQLRDLIAAVIPQGSAIVALGWSHAALGGTDEFRLLETPTVDAGGEAALAGAEARIRASGAQYLVVPAPPAGSRLFGDPLLERCRAAWTTVIDHRHVCTVFAMPAARAANR